MSVKQLVKEYLKKDDERFFREAFVHEIYKEAKNDLKNEQVVVDIGALAGEFSAYVYDQAKVIYAIEPKLDHYQELTNNVKKYELEKIKTYNLAIAGENKIGELYLRPERGGSNIVDTRGEVQKVEFKTLAKFVEDEGIEKIDILKVDVEGADVLIFGAVDFPKVCDKIQMIVGEPHGIEPDELFRPYGFKLVDLAAGVYVVAK